MHSYSKATQTRKPKGEKKVKVAKLDPDFFFSLCVRESTNWTCSNCGKKYETWESQKGYPANPGLHCSHYIGRANYAVRFDPMNADPHCYGCHAKFEGNPHVFKEWKLGKLGQEQYDILIEKSNNLMLGKSARKEKQQIAEHYKLQYEFMAKLRKLSPEIKFEFLGYF